MAEVSLENVTKIYPGDVLAVRNISLTVADREFMVLVGPSGCGKSTTLRLIAGLEEATEGRIRIGERVVNDVPPKDRDVAMVFQNYALYPHMSVFKNMAFGLKLRGYKRREIDQRVGEAAKILGITDLLGRKPRALSGGQQQRVALGRAIVRKPRVFLFDEPLSNLDAKLRVQMRAELSRLHRRLETTIIYVTHDQIEAMTLGQRIAVLDEGETQQVASPLDLYDRPANRFVAGFIGSPPMNFFEGTLKAMDGRVVFDEGKCEFAVPADLANLAGRWVEQRLILGIRPEALSLAPADAPGLGAVINVVEPLGDEQLVHLDTGAHEFIAKVEAHQRAEVGMRVQVALDPARIHLFEPESGANLDLAVA